uniref:Uncharacterized protein n=1 Tax=Ditylenchus dipsaci TaxID=166011 RepID=A0A915E1Q5_9BILA
MSDQMVDDLATLVETLSNDRIAAILIFEGENEDRTTTYEKSSAETSEFVNARYSSQLIESLFKYPPANLRKVVVVVRPLQMIMSAYETNEKKYSLLYSERSHQLTILICKKKGTKLIQKYVIFPTQPVYLTSELMKPVSLIQGTSRSESCNLRRQ